MRPPGILGQLELLAAEFDRSAHAPRLIEARNILHNLAAALAQIVRLFMRIHRGDPFELEPNTRRIVADAHPEAPQPFERFDREWTDLDLVNARAQRARST